MDTKGFINVTKVVMRRLQWEFDATRPTVWRALSFDVKGDAATAERIRSRAYELGGELMVFNE